MSQCKTDLGFLFALSTLTSLRQALHLRGGWGLDNDRNYEILGLRRNDFPSDTEIKKAYHKAALAWHPDRNRNSMQRKFLFVLRDWHSSIQATGALKQSVASKRYNMRTKSWATLYYAMNMTGEWDSKMKSFDFILRNGLAVLVKMASKIWIVINQGRCWFALSKWYLCYVNGLCHMPWYG